MTREEILDRLRKMKQLADRGVGGERENAERLLAEIAAQYGIDLADLEEKWLEEPRKKTAPAEGSGCGDCGAEIA